MQTVLYRPAEKSDVPALACILASEWETEEYWRARVLGYLKGELHPQKALMPREGYVAVKDESIVGFIAGHLTRRYECDGELEWINVIPEHRGTVVASELLRLLAAWFVEQKASRICVDVQPSNVIARRFYARHGAENLNAYWLIWNDIKMVLGEH